MDKLQVAKFDGHRDFLVWKVQVQAYLEANGWYGTVDGSVITPKEGDSPDLISQWLKTDAKAKAVILNSLETSVVRSVMTLNTAYDMWTRLTTLYQSRSKLSINLLLQKFHAYKMADDSDMGTHIANVESMAQQLSDLGQVVDEAQIISKLLQLPRRYRHLISAWDVIDEEKQTRENLIPRLLKEEKLEFGEPDSVVSNDNDSAAFSSVRPKPRNGNVHQAKPKFNGKCFYCHKIGHKKGQCRQLERERRNEHRNASSGNSGYMSSEVRNRKEGDFMFSAQSSLIDSEDWMADSGAARHMCNRRDWFSKYTELETKRPMLSASGHIIYAVGIGSVPIESFVDGKPILITVTDVLYFPQVQQNLLSIRQLTQHGLEVRFTADGLKILSGKRVIAIGELQDERLYRLKCRVVLEQTISANSVVSSGPQPLDVWHERFGHANYRTIEEAVKHKTISGLQVDREVVSSSAERFCEACCLGKQARLPIPRSELRATKCADLIHFDICGPMSVETPGGSKYVAIFVDDYSGYLMIYPLRNKSDILDAVQDVLVEAAAAGHKVRTLRSDNALEFKSAKMAKLLKDHLVKQEFTTPYVPAENGRVERQNRTIIESARSMLNAANLPKTLWGEASKAAGYIRNRVPLKRLEWKTPFEVWHGTKPSVEHLRIWGSVGYVYVEGHRRDKLDAKSERRILVGYDDKSNSYRMWLPGSKNIRFSRDIRFVESIPKRVAVFDISGSDDTTVSPTSLKSESKEFPLTSDESIERNPSVKRAYKDVDLSALNSPSHKRLGRQATIEAKEKIRSIAQDEDMDDDAWFASHVDSVCDVAYATRECPANFHDAMKSPEAEKWKVATASEYESLMSNKTWSLVERPSNVNVIKSMWVFRMKYRPNGSVERYKARLVVKGCSQRAGVDYFDTYSPVSRMTSIRCLLSMAASKDLEIVQCDVTTAFLYGELDEEVFMYQPEGYDDGSGRVCKLEKALYGLKQAPLQWNRKISRVLKQLHLKPCSSDSCVYVRERDNLIFALYVDDGLCIAPSLRIIEGFLESLEKSFKMTRCVADCFIGLEIERDRENRTLKIHQRTYLKKVLERFAMADCNPARTPFVVDQRLRRNIDENGKVLDSYNAPFRQLIGSLMYAAVGTRPEIAYIVNQLSQFLEAPSKEHWIAAKRVLRYLKGSLDVGITYSASEDPNQLIAYSDASWASEIETRKSVTGICLMLNNGIVGWKSKKQSVVTDSTTYAEYVAAHACSREVVWLRNLLEESGCEQLLPTVLNMDNAAAELLIKNPIQHERTKHVDIKFHYVRECFERGLLTIRHVSTDNQLADIFTKAVPVNKFDIMKIRLGIK